MLSDAEVRKTLLLQALAAGANAQPAYWDFSDPNPSDMISGFLTSLSWLELLSIVNIYPQKLNTKRRKSLVCGRVGKRKEKTNRNRFSPTTR